MRLLSAAGSMTALLISIERATMGPPGDRAPTALRTLAFLRAVREDPQSKGLLFAGTEFGVYVSFDDGDHWQSLQLNLPVTSVRDLAIHGDDLVVATHMVRSFWILDNITPLRQTLDAKKSDAFWLYHPATAVRIDNDSFPGTPIPPEEPTAENPPAGAVIDYFLKSAASNVKLEIFDAQQNLVQRLSSEDRHSKKHAPLPIAERWFPKPEVLSTTLGTHRFLWNFSWGGAGEPSLDEDNSNPSGPKVVPGTYQLRLTVDGRTQSQSLKVTMDPRSPATSRGHYSSNCNSVDRSSPKRWKRVGHSLRLVPSRNNWRTSSRSLVSRMRL